MTNTLAIPNYPALLTYAHILTSAPAGAAVQGVIERFHELEAHAPDAGQMIIQSIQYETYCALTADACAMVLCGADNEELKIALHGAEVLEELREGTACYMPTGEISELTFLPQEPLEQWCGGIASKEAMEALIFATLEILMDQTHNFPLSLEAVQYLVTYRLAVAMKRQTGSYPRKETERTIKLAKYAIPWNRPRSSGYICCLNGEVFLLDGDIDDGSCEDYLNAIRQAEKVVPHEDLKRYLMDRTDAPCFDFELEDAVNLWLGDEKKQRGRPVEPSDERESFDD